MAKVVCVIDIGSNSIRMVVYEKTSRFAFGMLHEAKSKVRISEGAYKNDGNLQELPMQRAYLALSEFLSIAKSFKAKKILCFATSALRDAPNKHIFLQKVRQNLKLNIKVIDGQKEAYFGAVASTNLLPRQKNALTIDIGGGSSEFAIIKNDEIIDTFSLELGTVRLKELFFDKGDIKGAKKYIDNKLEDLHVEDKLTLIGIGGTFRAISSSIMQRESYPLEKLHAYMYDAKILDDFLGKILDAQEQKLKKLGIKEDRFDVIKPGALILQRVLKKIKTDKILTSGVGIRDGAYLCDLLRNSKHRFPANYNVSLRYLLDRYIKNKTFSNQLSSTAKKLFMLASEQLNIPKEFKYELSIAAKVYPIGGAIHFYSKHKHSYYIVQNALEYGFTHQQSILIATLVRYAKRKLPSPLHVEKYALLLPPKEILNALSMLLSLSIALLSHRPQNVDFVLEFKNDTLIVKSKEELYLAKDAVKKLQLPFFVTFQNDVAQESDY